MPDTDLLRRQADQSGNGTSTDEVSFLKMLNVLILARSNKL
jgi:hypothetical protein